MGVLLFQMMFGNKPFLNTKTDRQYIQVTQQKWNSFWTQVKDVQISDNLKSILEGMLSHNPNKRPTIHQVKLHPWF